VTTAAVATVDLRALAPDGSADAVETFGSCLADTGFVKVTGHGIDPALIADSYAAAAALFALPEDVKQRHRVHNGYVPFGVEHARGNPVVDLKEYWHVGQEVPADHPLFAYHGPSAWPDELDPELRQVVRSLYRALEACAELLLEACAAHLGRPRRSMADWVADGSSKLRLLHYPPLGDDVPPGAVRAAAHEDINLITLLPAATDTGLELLDRQGNWCTVDAEDGDLVVDVGDMLSRHVDGALPSTTHRVVNPEDASTSRYSMPFFCHPRPDVVLGDPPITARTFLDERLAEIGLL
jgi:isopenicillin N synthase-like dioxygenase